MKRWLGALLWEPLPIPAGKWRAINGFLWRLWFVLMFVSALTPLKTSIPWLVFMSGYALFVGHLETPVPVKDDASSE